MSTHKYFDRICVVVIVFALVVTFLFMNGEVFGIEKIIDEDSEAHSDQQYFTASDLSPVTHMTAESLYRARVFTSFQELLMTEASRSTPMTQQKYGCILMT